MSSVFYVFSMKYLHLRIKQVIIIESVSMSEY